MIKLSSYGSFSNTEDFLHRMRDRVYLTRLDRFGAQGVTALQVATPKQTGETAHRWIYEIIQRPGYYSIQWLNTDVVEPGHIPIAVLIQYGHATKSGAWIQGIDYINPAMRPIFEQIAADAWREVTK
jgi:hypothetical protein